MENVLTFIRWEKELTQRHKMGFQSQQLRKPPYCEVF